MDDLVAIILLISFIPLLLLAFYPLAAWVRCRLFSNPVSRCNSFCPPVSIIIAAYSEDKYLREKLLSYLDPGEWIEGSEIILIVSGATDHTNSILKEFEIPGKIISRVFPERVPKIQAVNMAVQLAHNEILVFSDCRQKIKPQSLKNLIRNFSDPSVGTVTATLKDDESSGGESFLRRLLTFIAKCDSRSGSSLNVYGALYAQRRSLFVPFPDDILFDDLYVAVSTLAQHYRLIQEEEAVIYDIEFGQYYGGERIQRLTRGLLLFLIRHRSMFAKLKPGDLARFLIFKYIKLVIPFALALQAIIAVVYFYHTENLLIRIILLFIVIVLFLVRKSRNFLIMILRINYNIMLMVVKFAFFNERSTNWEKLKTK